VGTADPRPGDPRARRSRGEIPLNIVLNEWVLHDLMGDNGPDAQRDAAQLLVKLIDGSDRISAMAGSVWTKKAWELMKFNDPYKSELSRLLHLGILRDSRKCVLVYPHEVPAISEKLVAQTPESDLYLVQTYKTTNADVLATSDQKLMDRLAPFSEIRTVERADFLESFAGCSNVVRYSNLTPR
jgi:hypothetical protein